MEKSFRVCWLFALLFSSQATSSFILLFNFFITKLIAEYPLPTLSSYYPICSITCLRSLWTRIISWSTDIFSDRSEPTDVVKLESDRGTAGDKSSKL